MYSRAKEESSSLPYQISKLDFSYIGHQLGLDFLSITVPMGLFHC